MFKKRSRASLIDASGRNYSISRARRIASVITRCAGSHSVRGKQIIPARACVCARVRVRVTEITKLPTPRNYELRARVSVEFAIWLPLMMGIIKGRHYRMLAKCSMFACFLFHGNSLLLLYKRNAFLRFRCIDAFPSISRARFSWRFLEIAEAGESKSKGHIGDLGHNLFCYIVQEHEQNWAYNFMALYVK